LAAKSGHLEVVRVLHEAGANVESEDAEGGRAMHFCASTGQVGAIKTLHELGASVESETHHGTRPIHIAAREGQVEALGALVALGTYNPPSPGIAKPHTAGAAAWSYGH